MSEPTNTTLQTVLTTEQAFAPFAGFGATLLGHPEITLIIGLLDKYGPTLALTVARWFAVKQVTLDDVEAAFAPLKKYDEYGIPDVAPPAEPAVVAPV